MGTDRQSQRDNDNTIICGIKTLPLQIGCLFAHVNKLWLKPNYKNLWNQFFIHSYSNSTNFRSKKYLCYFVNVIRKYSN